MTKSNFKKKLVVTFTEALYTNHATTILDWLPHKLSQFHVLRRKSNLPSFLDA